MGVTVKEKIPGSGKFWIFACRKGRRSFKCVGSREAAKVAAADLEREITLEKLGIKSPEESAPVPFRDYAERWYKGHVLNNFKPASQRSYRGILDRYLIPRFEGRCLSDISRPDVKAFTHWMLEKGPGPSSVKTCLIVVSSIFNAAIEDGLLSVNPAARIGKYLKVPCRRGKAAFLTAEEGHALLEAAKTHNPRIHPLLFAGLRTGIRQGELIGLQWGDVDWNGKFIEVRRTNFNGHISSPKNGRIRRVDMSDGLAAVLADHRRAIAAEALKAGRPMEWVFPGEGGGPIEASWLRKRFESCLKKAGLRHVPFHALRHSFASQLLGLGESVAYVQAQLGHASIVMTVDTYGHLIPGANRKAVNRLDDLGKKGKLSPQAHPAEGATA
jgi:integrase